MTKRHRIGDRDSFAQGVTQVEIGRREICVVRIDDAFYAIGDRCSHQDVSLSDGELDADDLTIECPKHGASFSLESGQPLSLPPTQPVPTYDVVIEGDAIYLEMN